MPHTTSTRPSSRRAARSILVALLPIVALATGCAQSPLRLDNITSGIATGSIPQTAGPSTAKGTAGAAATATTGKPKAERISGSLYRVMATDRVISDRIERENYTLLKAAEATRQLGATHFTLVKAGEQGSVLPVLGTTGGNYGAYIRVLELEADQPAPIGALAADEIIQFFGPKFDTRQAGTTTPAPTTPAPMPAVSRTVSPPAAAPQPPPAQKPAQRKS